MEYALDLFIVVGARPNLPKVAPLYRALKDRQIDVGIIDTGQHYDYSLFRAAYKDLKLPQPDFSLSVGKAEPVVQTAKVIAGIYNTYRNHRPRATVVVGDVNSTLAAAIAANKMNCPLIHLEAGIRSFDNTMPEEANRILTDRLSDLLLAPTYTAAANLQKENVPGKVAVVGNTMIDSLMRHKAEGEKRNVWRRFHLPPDTYGVVTLHRPALVDNDGPFGACMDALGRASERNEIPLIFPCHPRTREALERIGHPRSRNITVTEPMGYLDFLSLLSRARLVITDSGGVQEESSMIGVPCLTYRDSTERPETVELGTNTLVGTKPARLAAAIDQAMKEDPERQPAEIPLWDGVASVRATEAIERFL